MHIVRVNMLCDNVHSKHLSSVGSLFVNVRHFLCAAKE